MNTSAPVASAAAQNGARRSSPSGTPLTLAAISTPAKPAPMSASSSAAASSGAWSDLAAGEPAPKGRLELGRGGLGRLGGHGPEPAPPRGPQRGQPAVLDPRPLERLVRLGVVAEEVDPRAQHDVVDPRGSLRGE